MKKILVLVIICIFAFENISLAQKGSVVSVEFYLNNNDTITLENISAREGDLTLSQESSDYKAVLTDAGGKALYAIYFDSGLLLTEARSDGKNTLFVREKSRHLLKVPYSGNVGEFTIYHSGLELNSFNLSILCLPDSICGRYESNISCPQDCQKNDGADPAQSGTEKYIPLAIGLILILLVGGALYWLIKRKRSLSGSNNYIS